MIRFVPVLASAFCIRIALHNILSGTKIYSIFIYFDTFNRTKVAIKYSARK